MSPKRAQEMSVTIREVCKTFRISVWTEIKYELIWINLSYTYPQFTKSLEMKMKGQNSQLEGDYRSIHESEQTRDETSDSFFTRCLLARNGLEDIYKRFSPIISDIGILYHIVRKKNQRGKDAEA